VFELGFTSKLKAKIMTTDTRISKQEAFCVEIGGNMLLLPVNKITLDFINLLIGSTVYSSTYTRTLGVVYYSTDYPLEIKLINGNVFNDPKGESQYDAIRKWDNDCVNAKELAEATED